MNGREKLQSYLDGELGARSARRLERQLEGDPKLRAELARLRDVGDLVRACVGEQRDAHAELWDRIVLRLPAIDAEFEEWNRSGRSRFGDRVRWLVRPLAVVSMAAIVAIAVGLWGEEAPTDVVQWLDAEGQPVMVLEGEGDMTIIWLLDGEPDELSGGFPRIRV